MIDHITLRVSDFDASKAFYSCVLAPLGHEPYDDDTVPGTEWGDFSIAADEKPPARNLHLAFVAGSREEVEAFHRAAMEAGYGDNGPPGERPVYHEGYYGAFVLDPDGNNVEAVWHGFEAEPGSLDHLVVRVRDLDASRRFYETVLQPVGFGVWAVSDEDDRVGFGMRSDSIWIMSGQPTENVHIAVGARNREEVDAFHRTAIEAGYRDNGPPGERPVYHEGYYGAFVLDPDGNNVEAVFHDR